jgi:hypothetical protein
MSSSPATTRPGRSASRAARPLPWPLLFAAVLAVLGLLAFLTLYLPARQAAARGNTVRVQDLTIRLAAQPDPAFAHGVDLDVAVEPAPGAEASVDIQAMMPTMGNMTAETAGVAALGGGAYRAVADLGMAGLWEVRVVVHRPGQADATARFRLNG